MGLGKNLLKKIITPSVLLDEGRKYYDLYECEGVPTTFLINENFEIVEKYGDKTPMSEIMIGIGKLLS